MRQVMSDLAGEGKIERVSRGQYVARDDPADPTDTDISVLSPLNTDTESGTTGKQDEGTDADEADTMPTAEEYEQQLAERADETDADEGEPTDSGNVDEDERTEKQGEETDADEYGDVDSPNPSAVLGGVDPRTLMMVVAVAAVGYVLVSSLSGGDQDDGTDPDEQVEASSGDDWPGAGLVE